MDGSATWAVHMAQAGKSDDVSSSLSSFPSAAPSSSSSCRSPFLGRTRHAMQNEIQPRKLSQRSPMSPLRGQNDSDNTSIVSLKEGATSRISTVSPVSPQRMISSEQNAELTGFVRSAPRSVPTSVTAGGHRNANHYANAFRSPPMSPLGRNLQLPHNSPGGSPSASPKTLRWEARWLNFNADVQQPQKQHHQDNYSSDVSRALLADTEMETLALFNGEHENVFKPTFTSSAANAAKAAGLTAEQWHALPQHELERLFDEWLTLSDHGRPENILHVSDSPLTPPSSPPPQRRSPAAGVKSFSQEMSPRRLGMHGDVLPPRSPSRRSLSVTISPASSDCPHDFNEGTHPAEGKENLFNMVERKSPETPATNQITSPNHFFNKAEREIAKSSMAIKEILPEESSIPPITLRRGPRSNQRSKSELTAELCHLREELQKIVPIERSGVVGGFMHPPLTFTKDELARVLLDCFNWPAALSFVLSVRLREMDEINGKIPESGKQQRILVSFSALEQFWRQSVDTTALPYTVFNVLTSTRRTQKVADRLSYREVYTLVRAVVHQHPDLEFLRSQEHAEFRERYCESTTIRILYAVGRSKLGIARARFLESNFASALFALSGTNRINQCLEYFSYEHFYVIYVKFWELDTNHDLWVSGDELLRYGEDTWSTAIVERIISHEPAFESAHLGSHIHFRDFVWLILAEEDKTTTTAIEFWFQLLDTDADGVISLFELEIFYREQHQRLRALAEDDATAFNDASCVIFDIIRPKNPPHIMLSDFKRCKHIQYVFNMIFSLRAMIEDEQLRPTDRAKYSRYLAGTRTPSRWEAFAQEAYITLAADDSSSDDGWESC